MIVPELRRAAARGRLVLVCLLWSVPAAHAAAADGCNRVLTLGDAEARLADDPDLRVARHDVDGALADLQTAGERPNPTLSLSSSAYDVRHGNGPGNAWDKQVDTVLQLEQPLERGGKRSLRRAAASRGVNAAEAGFADQKRQALLALRDAFYDLQLAQQKRAIDREIADAQAASQAAAEQRLRAGDIAAADVARLRVERARADNDVRQAEADLAAARVALAYLIGCGSDARFELAGDWPSPGAMPATDAAALDQRADVVAARERAAQAHSNFDLAQAQAVRDISVGLQVEHYPGGPPSPSDGDVLLGFDVSVPLHLFHAYQGEIARARSDAAAGDDALAQTRAQAEGDLRLAHDALMAAAARAKNFQDAIVPQAQAAADAIEYAYTRGALPLLDLLDARRTLHATRIDAATAQSDFAKALAGWRAATERYAAAEGTPDNDNAVAPLSPSLPSASPSTSPTAPAVPADSSSPSATSMPADSTPSATSMPADSTPSTTSMPADSTPSATSMPADSTPSATLEPAALTSPPAIHADATPRTASGAAATGIPTQESPT